MHVLEKHANCFRSKSGTLAGHAWRRTTSEALMAAAVRLRWKRDKAGYEIVLRSPPRSNAVLSRISQRREMYIVPLSGEFEYRWLEGTSDRVFEKLANARLSPKGALKFVNEYGFLFRHQHRANEMSLAGTDGFYHWCAYFSTMLALAEHRKYKDIIANFPGDETVLGQQSGFGFYTIDAEMRAGKELPDVFLRAQSLISFALMEFMQLILAGCQVMCCLRCGKFFTKPATSSARVRGVSALCGETCKKAVRRAVVKQGYPDIAGA